MRRLLVLLPALVFLAGCFPMNTDPMMMEPDHCAFTTFCDAFQEAQAGGRAGDLDEGKWSYSRLSQDTNPSQGAINRFVPVNAELCKMHETRLADNDSFICGQEFGESNHWMEAINDDEGYVMDSARITQPFDFANRTGTLDFSVDAKSTGSHGSWIEVWLTADPMESPHTEKPATYLFPRSGLGFEFDMPENCQGGIGPQLGNSLRLVDEYHNYVNTVHGVASPCFSTQDDNANHFQIKVATDHVEVWASDAGGMNFRQIANVPVALDFTRGYWHLQHAQYNAAKALSCDCGQNQFTYHWHAVSFDGPVVTPDRSYQVPDALSPKCYSLCGVNLGYRTPSTFTVDGVNPAGSQAWVTLNEYWFASPRALNVTVNGHTHLAPDPNPSAGNSTYSWHYLSVPIPTSDLVEDVNTIQVSNTGCSDQCPVIANVGLELVP